MHLYTTFEMVVLQSFFCRLKVHVKMSKMRTESKICFGNGDLDVMLKILISDRCV